MIRIWEALKIVRENLPPRQIRQTPLHQALNGMLADKIIAPMDSPAFDNSAMDGFAIHRNDIRNMAGQNGFILKIVGESQAGHPFSGKLNSGEAVRINTGAMIPAEAGAVVPVEETRLNGNQLEVLNAPPENQHIRFRGEEFRKGDLLVSAATPIAPPHIGLFASMGIREIPVFQPPRIAIFTTGSELVPLEADVLKEGQIRDSNSYLLQAAIGITGAELIHSNRLPDDPAQTITALWEIAGKADIILFSGGVSVGPHDHVKSAATQAGFQTLFWKVSQKPGKPLFAARLHQTLLFGLPGNPVSALMCFMAYVFPVIRFLRGYNFALPQVEVSAGQLFSNSMKRDHLLRVKFERHNSGIRAVPLDRQDSHMITSLTQGDGFIILRAGQEIPEGAVMRAFPFPWTNLWIENEINEKDL